MVEMVLELPCLPGTVNKARIWKLFYFPGLWRSVNYKMLYSNTRSSFMNPSQVSDLKVFKNIVATAIQLYLFLEAHCSFYWKKKN